MPQNARIPAVLLFSAIVMTACSLVRLAYDNVEWLSVRWADHYFDLDQEQEAAFRQGLKEAIENHRRDLLPEKIVFLRALAAAVEPGLTLAEARCATNWSQSLYRRTASLLTPVAADLLVRLSPEQVDYLAERMRGKDQEFTEEYVSGTASERVNRRAARISDRLGNWTGELSERQVRLVYGRTVELPDTASAWQRYRRSQQLRMLSLLRSGSSAEEVRTLLDDWWVDQSDEPGSLRVDMRTFMDGFAVMLTDLNQSLESWQRRRLADKLSGIAADLVELAPAETLPTLAVEVSTLSDCRI